MQRYGRWLQSAKHLIGYARRAKILNRPSVEPAVEALVVRSTTWKEFIRSHTEEPLSRPDGEPKASGLMVSLTMLLNGLRLLRSLDYQASRFARMKIVSEAGNQGDRQQRGNYDPVPCRHRAVVNNPLSKR